MQNQVGGMFERTLDAAIGRDHQVAESFKELENQLDQAKVRIERPVKRSVRLETMKRRD
jgi:phosphate uptake regulator